MRVIKILLILVISVALTSSALSMGRTPLKRSVAAAEGVVVEIDSWLGECLDVAVDSNGYIWAVGYTWQEPKKQATFRKYNPEGELISATNPAAERGGNTAATGVAVAPNGDVFVVGNCDSTGYPARATWDGFIVRYKDGIEIYNNIVRLSDNVLDVEHINSIELDQMAAIWALLGAELMPPLEKARGGHARVAIADGSVSSVTLLEEYFDQSDVTDALFDPDGGITVVGSVAARSPEHIITNDIIIRKYDSAGSVVWTTFYGNVGRVENSGHVNQGGETAGFIIFGDSQKEAEGIKNSLVLKVDSVNGDIIWTNDHETAYPETAVDGHVAGDKVVFYGTTGLDGNVYQRVKNAVNGIELETDIYETESQDMVNAVYPGTNADLVAVTRMDPVTRGKQGVLLRYPAYAAQSGTAPTPVGSNVTVSPVSDVSVTFTQVTQAGDTTVAKTITGPTLPAFLTQVGPYYNIETTATYTPGITLTINYDQNDVDPAEEKDLLMAKLIGIVGIAEVELVGGDVNEAFDTVAASLDALSVYSVVLITDPPAAIEALIVKVQSLNLKQGIENSLDVKLAAAQDALEEARRNATINASNKLQAFVNEVNAQSGKALTVEQADELGAWANSIIKALQ